MCPGIRESQDTLWELKKCQGIRESQDTLWEFKKCQGIRESQDTLWELKCVQEYERAVIFRLGRLLTSGARGWVDRTPHY